MSDIAKLINQKENRKLEFKQELPSKDKLIKTSIAFSNFQGEDLIIGIADGGEIIDKEKLGLDYSELRNQNLGNLLKKMKIIEQWGIGYEKIAKELKEYPEIKFEKGK